MTRGYEIEDIKEKLLDLLTNSKTGFSGLEISDKLGINRITVSKYLNIFSAEGLIKQKNIGNVIIWFVEDGIEKFHFPEDFFKARTRYSEYLISKNENLVYTLIRNCFHSAENPIKIITEIIVPGIVYIQTLFDQGKIGKSELTFIEKIISNSIQIIHLENVETNKEKNVIVISADDKSTLFSDALATSFHTDSWQVYSLGDMSSSIDVLFDLDLQKFLTKVWKRKVGIMIIVIFSATEEGLQFFAESVKSIKGKSSKKNLYLVLCGKLEKIKIDADFIDEDLQTVLQWSQSTFERSVS
jgi:methanogenic corrinoid protein MtbC1